MAALINTVFLLGMYIVLITFILAQINNGPNNDEDDDGPGGGWDRSDVDPPLDLPPGVYILPPDADDPSARSRIADVAY